MTGDVVRPVRVRVSPSKKIPQIAGSCSLPLGRQVVISGACGLPGRFDGCGSEAGRVERRAVPLYGVPVCGLFGGPIDTDLVQLSPGPLAPQQGPSVSAGSPDGGGDRRRDARSRRRSRGCAATRGDRRALARWIADQRKHAHRSRSRTASPRQPLPHAVSSFSPATLNSSSSSIQLAWSRIFYVRDRPHGRSVAEPSRAAPAAGVRKNRRNFEVARDRLSRIAQAGHESVSRFQTSTKVIVS